jgi:hypothetical protein
MERGKPALVVWLDKHEQEYGLGLLNGFLAEDQADIDGTAKPKGRNQRHSP